MKAGCIVNKLTLVLAAICACAPALDEVDNYRKAGDAIQACAVGGGETENG